MSLTEYTETGSLVTWNNGLMTRWCDTEEEITRVVELLNLTEYAVTAYKAIGHTVYGDSSRKST